MIPILTEEQKRIAEENHALIPYFIKKFNVSYDEFYDLFAIDYIKCIKAWDKEKAKLATLLYNAFKNRISMEKRRKYSPGKRPIETAVSLNTVIFNERNEITLEELIADNADLEQNFELTEAINFFMSYDVTKYLMLGYTQKEIGEKLGYSQSYVSRLQKRLNRNMKRSLCNANTNKIIL